MRDLIQSELVNVVSEWNAGKPVRSIALGHDHHNFHQKKAHALVFNLISAALERNFLMEFSEFDAVADELARGFHLSADETAAAKSLAWAALRRGWAQATAGFPDSHSITVRQDEQA